MMRKTMFCLLTVLTIILVSSTADALFLGTCEGYIKNGTGSTVSGVNVDVTVNGCSGSGCSGSTTSDSNGYYVVANLNLQAGGTVTVSASGSGYSGSNSGTADDFQAASVNVTVCQSPTDPTLTPQSDIHYPPEANLSWTSGTGSNGVYDRYQLDSNSIVDPASSPQFETSLSYTTHTWRVQTCNQNDNCCSNWVSDSFDVYNDPPNTPSLTDQGDLHGNSVTLSWTSQSPVDSEGDVVHDEYQFQSNPINTSATSPQNESNLDFGSYTWKVRTCDNLSACSSWSTDSFSVVNHPCPVPALTDQLNTHYDNVTLSWTSSSTDTDGDPCQDRYQFDYGTVLDPATSPQNESNLTLGQTYTWRVQSCDNYSACSSWASDSFTITNNPPTTPTLTDQGHTDSDYVILEWTSGTDPNNDTTYDQYDFNGTVKNATSPQIEQDLSGVEMLTWRVRTCDTSGACSSWASDTFIKYTCPPCEDGDDECDCDCPPCAGGGIICTPKIIRERYNVSFCNETWICEDWGECLQGGYQFRECVDINECNATCSRPALFRECTPPEIEKPVVTEPVEVVPIWSWISLVANALLALGIVYLFKLLKEPTVIKRV